MANTLITHTTSCASEGMQLQQRGICYKKNVSRKSKKIVVIVNPNNVHAFNSFEEEDQIESYKCYFRLNDLKCDDLNDMAVLVAEE